MSNDTTPTLNSCVPMPNPNSSNQRYPMKKTAPSLLQSLRLVAALAVGAWLTVSLPAYAQAPTPPKPTAAARLPVANVANFTSFSDADLGAYLANNLKPEIQQAVRERGLAVVATTWRFGLDGGMACLAEVGLAQVPPKGVNPRYPAVHSDSFEFGSAEDCAGDRLRSAVAGLNDVPLGKLLEGIERTANAGASRKAETPDSGRVWLHDIHVTDYDLDPLVGKLLAFSLGEAVDYRHVTTSVRSWSTRFDSGQLMCVAEAGFSARPPEDRNARIAGTQSAYVALRDGGSQSDCEQAAALGAVEKLMKDPWVGDKGRFQGFERTREQGVPLPDMKRVAAVERRLIAASRPAPRTVASRSTQINRVSCTNQCFNGNCLRTFPDGKQERWQAPRVYKPSTGNWEWETSSCGA